MQIARSIGFQKKTEEDQRKKEIEIVAGFLDYTISSAANRINSKDLIKMNMLSFSQKWLSNDNGKAHMRSEHTILTGRIQGVVPNRQINARIQKALKKYPYIA